MGKYFVFRSHNRTKIISLPVLRTSFVRTFKSISDEYKRLETFRFEQCSRDEMNSTTAEPYTVHTERNEWWWAKDKISLMIKFNEWYLLTDQPNDRLLTVNHCCAMMCNSVRSLQVQEIDEITCHSRNECKYVRVYCRF